MLGTREVSAVEGPAEADSCPGATGNHLPFYGDINCGSIRLGQSRVPTCPCSQPRGTRTQQVKARPRGRPTAAPQAQVLERVSRPHGRPLASSQVWPREGQAREGGLALGMR